MYDRHLIHTNRFNEARYGDFAAIFRPHFQTGGEMGQWDSELILLLPSSCRIFASAGAGFNWADVDLLAEHGIWYANGAGASDEAVSDTGLYMILSVFRNFTRAQLAARTCDVEEFEKTHKLIATISANPMDHVLGIVGLGNISKKLAYKARTALGMKIHYFDIVRASQDVEAELGAIFHENLDDLLAIADCVSLHTPLNKHVRVSVSSLLGSNSITCSLLTRLCPDTRSDRQKAIGYYEERFSNHQYCSGARLERACTNSCIAKRPYQCRWA